MVLEYLPTCAPYITPSFVGKYTSTMVRIWALPKMLQAASSAWPGHWFRGRPPATQVPFVDSFVIFQIFFATYWIYHVDMINDGWLMIIWGI